MGRPGCALPANGATSNARRGRCCRDSHARSPTRGAWANRRSRCDALRPATVAKGSSEGPRVRMGQSGSRCYQREDVRARWPAGGAAALCRRRRDQAAYAELTGAGSGARSRRVDGRDGGLTMSDCDRPNTVRSEDDFTWPTADPRTARCGTGGGTRVTEVTIAHNRRTATATRCSRFPESPLVQGSSLKSSRAGRRE